MSDDKEALVQNRKCVEQAVDLLNQAFNTDPVALSQLCRGKIPCVGTMEAHPSWPVTDMIKSGRTIMAISALGMVNAAIKPFTDYRIAMITEGEVLKGFQIWNPPGSSVNQS